MLLLLLMLAVMPFQSWAGASVCASGNTGLPADRTQHACAVAAGGADQDRGSPAVFAATAFDQADHDGSDAKDPSQGGADLAESLLPAAPLRVAAGLARSGAPLHRPGLLPDPDLPLQQRPPSA
ncbi:hypothetical protein AB4Z48_05840 [Cupriavidus sp. 2TAF22]|uniref:hypothetical protein n=2 Tax=Cupriavidus TaxID=106589 RepID=UPI003F910E85